VTTPAWIATTTIATGGMVSAATMNSYWRDNANHLATPCSAQAIWTANTTPANATWTDVLWGGENFDTDGIHDNTTNTARLTIPTGFSGRFAIFGFVQVGFNPTNSRAVRLRKNGTGTPDTLASVQAVAGSQPTTVPFFDEQILVAGDYLTVQVYQDAGGPLNVTDGKVTIRKTSN
jgi:hypothetical protein